jgi:hypothetical protein
MPNYKGKGGGPPNPSPSPPPPPTPPPDPSGDPTNPDVVVVVDAPAWESWQPWVAFEESNLTDHGDFQQYDSYYVAWDNFFPTTDTPSGQPSDPFTAAPPAGGANTNPFAPAQNTNQPNGAPVPEAYQTPSEAAGSADPLAGIGGWNTSPRLDMSQAVAGPPMAPPDTSAAGGVAVEVNGSAGVVPMALGESFTDFNGMKWTLSGEYVDDGKWWVTFRDTAGREVDVRVGAEFDSNLQWPTQTSQTSTSANTSGSPSPTPPAPPPATPTTSAASPSAAPAPAATPSAAPAPAATPSAAPAPAATPYPPLTTPPDISIQERDEQNWTAAWHGMWDSSLPDMVQGFLNIVSRVVTLRPAPDLTDWAKFGPPAPTRDPARDAELLDNYRSGGWVTTTVSLAAPIGGAGLLDSAVSAASKLPALEGMGMGGGGRLIGPTEQWLAGFKDSAVATQIEDSAIPTQIQDSALPTGDGTAPLPMERPPTLKPSVLPQYPSKDSFMNAMRRQLLARRAAGNPSLLDYLLDAKGEWQKGSLVTKSGGTIRGRYALSNPDAQIVQAGHLQAGVYAKAVGNPEYLMLEDADMNWLSGQTEGTGQYTSKPAVIIDGHPMDIPTARLHESHRLLPAGTVEAAPVIEPPEF